MKIEKVILQNIGVYVNKNEFDYDESKILKYILDKCHRKGIP